MKAHHRFSINRRTSRFFVALLAASLLVSALSAAGCGTRPIGSPDEIMKKAIAAQDSLKTVHMELDSELDLKVPGSQRSAAMTYDGVYEKPDRWRLKIRSSGAKSEVIILGDRTFVKLPGSDSWTEKKSDVLESGSSPGEMVSSKYLKSASNVELVDRKGESYHLRFDLDVGKFAKSFNVTGVDPSVFAGKKARMEVWVLQNTMNIEKATMSFNGDLSEATPGKISMAMEVEFSEFNEPVSIEPPSLGTQ